VSVTASAFAFDGFAGAANQIVKRPRSDAARQRQLLEVLKQGFRISAEARRWLPDLDWLFATARRPAVHHGEEWYETVPHPELDTHVSVEHRDYSAAGAERALGIAFDVVETCLAKPKPALEEWARSRLVYVSEWLR
jgi:hypothetical protein